MKVCLTFLYLSSFHLIDRDRRISGTSEFIIILGIHTSKVIIINYFLPNNEDITKNN